MQGIISLKSYRSWWPIFEIAVLYFKLQQDVKQYSSYARRQHRTLRYYMLNVKLQVIGLTRSEKTSLMTTPKRPGVQIWQMNLRLPMDPPRDQKFGRWTFVCQWTPQVPEMWQMNLHLPTNTPLGTRNLADEPSSADGPPPGTRHLADEPSSADSNFTLLLTSSGQEWQFHTATDI